MMYLFRKGMLDLLYHYSKKHPKITGLIEMNDKCVLLPINHKNPKRGLFYITLQIRYHIIQ